MAVAKEQIRQIISENNISSVADVYSLLKESFKDILQELMEAELDASLGYQKIERTISNGKFKKATEKSYISNSYQGNLNSHRNRFFYTHKTVFYKYQRRKYNIYYEA